MKLVLDYGRGHVLDDDEVIGPIFDPNTIRLVNKLINRYHYELSDRLNEAYHEVKVNVEVCPICGSKFRVSYELEAIEVGRCEECYELLLRKPNCQVYIASTGQKGFKYVNNRLISPADYSDLPIEKNLPVGEEPPIKPIDSTRRVDMDKMYKFDRFLNTDEIKV